MKKMKIRNLLPALGLITLAAMPFTEAVSSELLGYVNLERIGTFFSVNGGGVQKFSIGTQYDADDKVTDQTSIVGGVLQAIQNAQGDGNSGLIYAICTEHDEYLTTTSRYALYRGLDGAPSATGDITTNEAGFIDQVLTAKFGDSLFDDDPVVDYAINIRGLQALLWEAGTKKDSRKGTPANDVKEDFENKTIDMTANTGTGKATAEAWLQDDGFPGLDRVTTYVLIADGQQQDFAFFLPQKSVPPLSSPPLPVPGTLLLISLGLLGIRLGWRKG